MEFNPQWSAFRLLLGAFVLQLAPVVVIFRGRVNLGGLLTTLITLALSTTAATMGNGIHDSATFGYQVVIVVALFQ